MDRYHKIENRKVSEKKKGPRQAKRGSSNGYTAANNKINKYMHALATYAEIIVESLDM